jgi:Predicted amidophosphoribosyltransferases
MCFFDKILDVIFPNVCGICDEICSLSICNKCRKEIDKFRRNKIKHYKDKSYELHIFIFKYDGVIRDRLLKYKFNGKSYLYKMFSNSILENKKICDIIKQNDGIISVPIHKKRLFERGYNQSELISKEISKRLGIEDFSECLIKNRNTKSQSELSKSERKTNIIGVYSVIDNNNLYNRDIVLVDDIYTTGSTVQECSKILKQNGVKKITILTIAKD